MLTPEQAELLRQEQVMLEYAEVDQAKAQEKMDQYYNAIKKVSDAMGNASDDQRKKMANMLPSLIQWYRAAERERGTAEDKYWQHAQNINSYNQLDAQQVAPQWKRREAIIPEIIEDEQETPQTVIPSTVNRAVFNSITNNQRVPRVTPLINQDIINTNMWVGWNISNPYLYGWENVPQEIRDARYAYMNNWAFSSWRRKAANALRNQWYTVWFWWAVKNWGGASWIYRLNPVPNAFWYGRTAGWAYDYADLY